MKDENLEIQRSIRSVRRTSKRSSWWRSGAPTSASCSSGGEGIIEQQAGLPIGIRGLYRPHAREASSSYHDGP